MKRILVIGINGAGKSTFANKLGKKLNLEVIHLDKIYYQPGWQHTQTKEEWREQIKNLVQKDKWIIDGQYNSTLDIRMPIAETIIYFDFNKLFCLYRIVKRIFDRTQPFDKAEGNLNKISCNLIKKVIKFPKKYVLKMLGQYKDSKNIFVVTNGKEVEALLERLSI